MERTDIGEKLRELRGNTPQRMVAKHCNISTSALAMYESGKRTPKDEIKKRLADYFKVSVGSLFFDDEVHTSET